jgi:hypothetical protein
MSSGLLTLPGLRMRVRAPSPAATEPTSPARWHRASERLRRWTGLPPLLTALLVAHLAFCLVRFPAGAVAKRHESVQEWQERGADGWCYRNADEETRRVARWLCENVQPGQIVRYMGGEQGALQMLAPLLFPPCSCATTPNSAGLPIARSSVWRPRGCPCPPVRCPS